MRFLNCPARAVPVGKKDVPPLCRFGQPDLLLGALRLPAILEQTSSSLLILLILKLTGFLRRYQMNSRNCIQCIVPNFNKTAFRQLSVNADRHVLHILNPRVMQTSGIKSYGEAMHSVQFLGCHSISYSLVSLDHFLCYQPSMSVYIYSVKLMH